MDFARDFSFRESGDEERPCVMQNLNIDRTYFKQSISQFGYFCPVSWKLEKKYVSCTHIPEYSVLYKNLFFFFANAEMRDIFVSNPKRFTESVLFSNQRNIPKRLSEHKAAEIAESEKSLMGYCPVTLMDQEKLVNGDPLLVLQIKEEKYILSSEENLVKFFQHPSRYSKV